MTNYCLECGKKHLKPKDSLSVIMTGYCCDCWEYINSDDYIARYNGVSDEKFEDDIFVGQL